MTLPIILVLAALLSLFLLLYLVRRVRHGAHDIEDMATLIRPLDLDAFRNLTDAGEEKFLRDNLSGKEFRAVQRERVRAAVEYVSVTSFNATILLRWGEAAVRSQDPHIALEGRKLVDNATSVRLYSLLYLAKLHVTMVLPNVSPSLGRLADNYQCLKAIAAQLALLQQPKRVSQLSAVLG